MSGEPRISAALAARIYMLVLEVFGIRTGSETPESEEEHLPQLNHRFRRLNHLPARFHARCCHPGRTWKASNRCRSSTQVRTNCSTKSEGRARSWAFFPSTGGVGVSVLGFVVFSVLLQAESAGIVKWAMLSLGILGLVISPWASWRDRKGATWFGSTTSLIRWAQGIQETSDWATGRGP